MINFIDEKSLYGAMANDVRSIIETIQKFVENFWISEES